MSLNRKPSDFIAQGWCRGYAATDAEGEEVSPIDAKATHWDILGAISAAYPEDSEQQEAIRHLVETAVVNRGKVLLAFNDVHWMSKELIIDILRGVGQ